MDTNNDAKRRQLNRRDSDDKVNRVVVERLGHIPQSLWEHKVNENGLTIRDIIKKEMKGLAAGKRLSTKSWVKLHSDFALCESLADALEERSKQKPPK